nr:MAG TPA: hypothetical protein [Caudoviricetes sp.]
MTYEEFKKLAEGKSADEIMNIVHSNVADGLTVRKVYYNTWKVFTSDGVALVKGGSTNNATAPARLLHDAFKLSTDYAEQTKVVEGINPELLIGKMIWNKVILDAKQSAGKIFVTISGGKSYGFRNIDKLMSLVK